MTSVSRRCVGLLAIGLVCLGNSSCSHNPPEIERCFTGDAGFLCVDRRKPKDKQEYIVPYGERKDFDCTNIDDSTMLIEWVQRQLENRKGD